MTFTVPCSKYSNYFKSLYFVLLFFIGNSLTSDFSLHKICPYKKQTMTKCANLIDHHSYSIYQIYVI